MIHVIVLQDTKHIPGMQIEPHIQSFHNSWDASEFLKNTWNPIQLQELVTAKKIQVIEGNAMRITPKTEDLCIIHF